MVKIEHLTKIFKTGKGIHDISFSFERGDIVGLIGDNGAGKSTIIKTIFNEYSKDLGEIFVDDKEISRKDYKNMAFFPDQSIYPNNITIEEYCIYSGMLADISRKECKKRTLQLLNFLNLSAYKNKKFKVLSAGMQKRALLAITMISNPEIIVLDEPTANLDIKTRLEFMELLKELAADNKIILITSHIINELQGLINKLIIINEGTLIYDRYLNAEDDITTIYKNATQKQIDNFEIKKESLSSILGN
ncbi:ABC transporter ATP-binding protein [Spiroplasma culicicola]|uniref:ABC transporter ATP-binding protein n=1 Tax=Spiroplasma culicicola AES-1 TaxID=1276246 RepID=W6A872_9MOLU|nr:ABC transporter ATP-binding protein [Spiroplasma culicicola]AHI53176.1 ABC transporter ATP-binding protein [Spiroplasma culicicola AES-1]